MLLALLQLAQNPSPMTEQRRAHGRLQRQQPAGRRETLSMGRLFVPRGWKAHGPVLFFFHGGDWVPEAAGAARNVAVVTVQLGAGSSVYERPFLEAGRFLSLLEEAEAKAGAPFGAITAGGWSAGCGALRAIIRDEGAYAHVDRFLAIDGIHAGYGDEENNLGGWLRLAQDAVEGRKRLLITHSEVFPGTYASTTETADWLLRQLGLDARPVLRWGPGGMQQLSEVHRGHLLLRGYAGNSAPDHVDHLHALPQWLRTRF